MYPVILFVHSWLRWLVLGACLVVVFCSARGFFRGLPWSRRDTKASEALVRLADLQFTLGLLLYLWLSPIVRSAFADMAVAMRSAPLRFFAVEHITAMVLGVAFLHIGHVRSRRAQVDTRRHRNMLLGSGGLLLMALAGIPWPGLKQARPLARTSVFEAEVEHDRTPEIYGKRCATCHGATGYGDGLAAAAMLPKPRDFSDARWQATLTDADLRQVIKDGGLSRGLSASMPPHPDLSAPQVEALVRFIRGVPGAKRGSEVQGVGARR